MSDFLNNLLALLQLHPSNFALTHTADSSQHLRWILAPLCCHQNLSLPLSLYSISPSLFHCPPHPAQPSTQLFPHRHGLAMARCWDTDDHCWPSLSSVLLRVWFWKFSTNRLDFSFFHHFDVPWQARTIEWLAVHWGDQKLQICNTSYLSTGSRKRGCTDDAFR